MSIYLILIIFTTGILYLILFVHKKEMKRNQDNKETPITNKNHVNSFEKQDYETVIVNFKGSKYNITDYIVKHPGGKKVLLDNNGKDIEKLMLENKHSNNAYEILEKYRIIS